MAVVATYQHKYGIVKYHDDDIATDPEEIQRILHRAARAAGAIIAARIEREKEVTGCES